MKKRLFIYRIRHLESGRSYIGWTINPEKRWRRHLSLAKRGGKNAIHCALRLYGADAFGFDVIEELVGAEADARAREVWWVAAEGTLSPSGYNMTEGGDGADGLGRLAAAAHAARRAVDAAADSAARSERTKKANAAMPPGARSEAARRMWANRSPELIEQMRAKMRDQAANESAEFKRARARKAHEQFTPEQRTERARRANRARSSEQVMATVAAMQAALTPEMRSEIGKAAVAAKIAKTTPEQRSASALKTWATRRRNAASVKQLE